MPPFGPNQSRGPAMRAEADLWKEVMVHFYGPDFRGRIRAGEETADFVARSVLGPEDFSDDGTPESEPERQPWAPPLAAPAGRQEDAASSASGRSWAALEESELLRRLQAPFDPAVENVEGFEGRVQRAATVLERRGLSLNEGPMN